MRSFLFRPPTLLSGLCRSLIALTALVPLTAAASPPVAPTEALSPEEQQKAFKLPAGFEIQLVAAEPQIQKPMNMAFDARGRLWVTHSIEYPFAPKDGAAHRDGLTVLSDFDPDGRARQAVRFADDLNIPIGVLPLGSGDEVIVWSIPNIWKLSDTDGDGKADSREVLYGPFEFVDTHGDQNAFRLGPDGWVYACHGFRNDSKVKLKGQGAVVLTMQSGNTYRFRPDGSAIEQVSWGQVNPFGMCFDTLGNQFTADCHSRPVTMVLRGGYYESFGKPHDGLGYAPAMTGHDHGSTGIAGAVVYDDATGFPPDYQGNLFVGNVITNTVHRDSLAWKGSSPWVDTPEDFLVCDDWWFRPVDLQMGPDGALYIADFYNCIIGHYEVDLLHPRRDRERGRIWRVVWKGSATPSSADVPRVLPDLAKASTQQLFRFLSHPNQTVRRLMYEELLSRSGGDLEIGTTAKMLAVDATISPPGRSLATWLTARLGGLDPATARAISGDAAALVRVHLVKALDGVPGWDADRVSLVSGKLLSHDADPFVHRAAAEALAHHPDGDRSFLPLLAASRSVASEDVQLAHALRIAIRNHLRPSDAGPAVTAADLARFRLEPEDRVRVISVAVAVPDNDVAWSAFGLARTEDVPENLLLQTLSSVAQNCPPARIEEAATFARTLAGADRKRKHRLFQSLFDGLTRSGRTLAVADSLSEWGTAWATDELRKEGGRDGAATQLALKVVEQLHLDALFVQVAAALADRSLSPDVRATAAAAGQTLDRAKAGPLLAGIALDAGEPAALREAVFRQLGSTDAETNRETLCEVVATAPPSLRQAAAWALATRPEGAERLMQLVSAGKTTGTVLQYGPVSERLRASNIADFEARLADLTRDLPPADEAIRLRIDAVAAAHRQGTASADTGRALFNKTCAACHKLGGVGPAIGPQLDGIGQRGSERLLEDILDPARNVDEAFRLTTVTTTDGRAVSGLKLRDEGGDLVLIDTLGKEIRVAAADIDEIGVSRLSPMPANVAEQIGEENIPHLLEFLLQQRQTSKPN